MSKPTRADVFAAVCATLRRAEILLKAKAAGQPRLYIAHLGRYNAGELKGGWIAPETDADDVMEQIRKACGVKEDEEFEWAVHDSQHFPDLGEHPSADDIALAAELTAEHGEETVAAAMDVAGDLAGAQEYLEDGFAIVDSAEDYAREMAENHGGLKHLDEAALESYFDFERWGEDLFLESTTRELKSGQTVVFNRS